ncbi:osmoprotectant ABC transporter substrate-binding protein [Sporosarcina limicola]|uniref:Osmoprotectant transport system substrate-binding protein n=1 Tax=Sporosarcina limicola TaxID=34101 RepID=A0A927MJS6_9BACL|nr:osmoprotectant ABC transporter substrate-binding protein [Sporosarcina limicola]MBE1555995.1 osmoprotectant transport system substrate-binding protein [Sporosarcina limicola]
MNIQSSKLLIVIVLSAVVVMNGCSLPGLKGPSNNTIMVGTMNTSESQIMGHVVRLMIEHHTDLHVGMINNLGSSIVSHKAMMNKEIDISGVRYTGTDVAGSLGMEPIKDPKEAMKVVQEGFTNRFDQTWFDSYGFANSYAFTVTKKLADEKNIKTVSDLKKFAPNLRLGVDNSWIKRKGDGYEGFIKDYGFEFGHLYPMQIGLVYKAVNSGEMDVVLAYTTDGRVKSYELVVLEDDKRFFPPYDASPVIRNDVLEKHPELNAILQKLVGKFSTKNMQVLNYEADGKMKEPSLVAKEFLEENHYFD